MYVLSNEVIKVNDYFLADDRNSMYENDGIPKWKICKCTKKENDWIYCNEFPGVGLNHDWTEKIIATTNKELLLPGISKEFINFYRSFYNANEIPIEFTVEYIYEKFFTPVDDDDDDEIIVSKPTIDFENCIAII